MCFCPFTASFRRINELPYRTFDRTIFDTSCITYLRNKSHNKLVHLFKVTANSNWLLIRTSQLSNQHWIRHRTQNSRSLWYSANKLIMEICGAVKSYDWGRVGHESKVATLTLGNQPEFQHELSESKPYAELWYVYGNFRWFCCCFWCCISIFWCFCVSTGWAIMWVDRLRWRQPACHWRTLLTLTKALSVAWRVCHFCSKYWAYRSRWVFRCIRIRWVTFANYVTD